VTCATPVAHGLDGSTGWLREVDAGHEFPVGEPGGVKFVGAFAELDANVSDLGSEGGDPPVELVDIVGCTEPGGLPGLLAHELGAATLELLHAGGVAGAASLGSVELCLQRGTAYRPGIGVWGLGGEGVDDAPIEVKGSGKEFSCILIQAATVGVMASWRMA